MRVERSGGVRTGLRRILDDDPDITVVGGAANAEYATTALSERGVDVVVVNALVNREAIRALGDPSHCDGLST